MEYPNPLRFKQQMGRLKHQKTKLKPHPRKKRMNMAKKRLLAIPLWASGAKPDILGVLAQLKAGEEDPQLVMTPSPAPEQ